MPTEIENLAHLPIGFLAGGVTPPHPSAGTGLGKPNFCNTQWSNQQHLGTPTLQ